MPKITSEPLPTTSEVNALGLSTKPYLTVFEAETQKTNRIPTVDEERTVRMYVKQYAWGETFIRTFPKPLPNIDESRSKPPTNIGERASDGLSNRGKSRITRAARMFQHTYNRCNMITLGYGDTSLSGHRESKKDLDRFIKTTARYCKKQYGEFQYVWVAEIQEKRLARTGESIIHYHLLTPHYIPKKLVNKGWNNAVNKPRIKNGLPTEPLYPHVMSCYNGGAYIAKYCQKEGHLILGNGYNMSQATSNAIKPTFQQCYDITPEHSYNVMMFESQHLTKNREPLEKEFEDGYWFKWFPHTHEYAFYELLKYSLDGNESLTIDNQERQTEGSKRSTEYVSIEYPIQRKEHTSLN